ncbi:MAG: hypothetical protein HYV97_12345 [Bdellovibrio sp.]|nr:hypothetical protein [Bdellovibrio sp.]
MGNKKRLLMEQEFRTKGRIQKEAVCKVQIHINEDSGMHEVVLTEPEDKNYRGISTTNYFEVFATDVKNKFLQQVSSDKIQWFDLLKWKIPGLGEQLIAVKLDWKDGQYMDPQWRGVVA